MNNLTWFTSSYSGQNNNCVEVVLGVGTAVRDSKDPTGAVLTFPRAAWAAFTVGIRAGDFE